MFPFTFIHMNNKYVFSFGIYVSLFRLCIARESKKENVQPAPGAESHAAGPPLSQLLQASFGHDRFEITPRSHPMGISGGRDKVGNCLGFMAHITGWFCQSICKLIQTYFSKLFQGLIAETMWHSVTVLKKQKHVNI